MGGDGGVIATKRAFARGVGKGDEKKEGRNVHVEQATRATTCALTNQVRIEYKKIILWYLNLTLNLLSLLHVQPLQAPVVACELGNIFNKEAVLSALLDRGLPEDLSHIRGLRDLKDLQFTESSTEDGKTLRVCPVTQDEFNGSHPFVVVWTTGKVLSEKAVREIGIDGLQAEYGPFTADDLVKLIPSEHEMNGVRAAMHRRRELKKASKKAKAAADGADTQAVTEERKSKKRTHGEIGDDSQREGDKRPSTQSASSSATNNLVRKAAGSVEQAAQQSQVFKSLFHKDGEKDKKDRDLFMTVAGLRYTIN